MSEFEHLFEPLSVGTMRLRNRVVMPAMHIGMADDDGFITERFTAFYEERAKAGPGPGLIIIGGCYPETRGKGAPRFVAIDDDRYVPRLREFTERIHSHGSRVAAQLYHSGRYAHSMIIGEQPVSASDVPSRFTRETPRPLSIGEIGEVQGHYAQAARRARDAGFDASELICCSGYLVNQFLSPLTNRREDRYGGDLYARITFLLETITAIKEATGADFPLICRLSGSDFMEGSHTLEETRVIAAEMEKAGVDLISVTGGWHETRVPQITMNVPRGAYVYLAEGIREAVEKVPVVACNRINTPEMAEAVLAEDRADLVGMARAFVADPEYLRKAKEGRTRDIMTCIACNQGCFDHVFMLKPITCTLNPRVGRERETELVPAGRRKKVLIAGGGPAGMEASWVAARRGHEVVLAESSGELGGQGNIAAVPPGREEWSEMVRSLARHVEKEGAEVRLNTTVTPALVRELEPDAVVLATGAGQVVPRIEGMDGPNVVYAWDVLSGEADTQDTIVVVGGGAVGLETAMFLAEMGKDVTVVEMLEKCGADIGLSTRWTILQDARTLGVKTEQGRCVDSIDSKGVNTSGAGGVRRFDAETVVIAVGSCPNNALEKELSGDGISEDIKIFKVGDCVEARKALDAIKEGFEAGLSL